MDGWYLMCCTSFPVWSSPKGTSYYSPSRFLKYTYIDYSFSASGSSYIPHSHRTTSVSSTLNQPHLNFSTPLLNSSTSAMSLRISKQQKTSSDLTPKVKTPYVEVYMATKMDTSASRDETSYLYSPAEFALVRKV